MCTTNPKILIVILYSCLCEDSDFSLKLKEACDFFDKHGYPASYVQANHAQLIGLQSALQMSQKENSDRILFTLTFHPHNHTVKSIVLKNFKLLENEILILVELFCNLC